VVQPVEAKLEGVEPILFSLRPLPRHAHQGQPTSSQHLKRLCDKFCKIIQNFLALHQIFEEKHIRKRRNEGRKPKQKKIENIMNKPRPPTKLL
jgi:hypothetical protein